MPRPAGASSSASTREVRPPEGEKSEQLAAMTQACADALAEGIREHPQDWHMLQRVFVADLVPVASPELAW